jgi:hypothetical protein
MDAPGDNIYTKYYTTMPDPIHGQHLQIVIPPLPPGSFELFVTVKKRYTDWQHTAYAIPWQDPVPSMYEFGTPSIPIDGPPWSPTPGSGWDFPIIDLGAMRDPGGSEDW